MTSLVLLFWIALGLVLQLAIFLAISFWRHWQQYQRLRLDAGAEAGIPPFQAEAAEIPAPAAWSGYRSFRVTHKVTEDPAGTVCSFLLAPEDGRPLPPFLPGQYLSFRLDLPGAAEPLVRCYSLSDAPRPDHYRVSIKRVSPPGRSSGHFHDHVEVGSVLQVRAPAGHFHLDRGDGPVVLIAGGIGITPMLSMANWSLTEQPNREVWLFYGVRHGGELVMKDHLENLAARHGNFHLCLCYSEPSPEDLAATAHGHRGRVDLALLRQRLPLRPFHFYLCGPTAMMATLVPALEDWGVPEARIHYEAFGPASLGKRKAMPVQGDLSGPTPTVSFARSGRALPWDPAAGSLLEFAEANGIHVNSGCRAGGCGSCQTTIRGGEVSYRQAPDFDPEPGACLLCVAMPKSDLTLEA